MEKMGNLQVITRLMGAGQKIIELAHSGTLFAACDGEEPQRSLAVQTFDELSEACAETAAMLKGSVPEKPVNPFVEYRKEILGHYSTATRLASLVLHLYNGNAWTLDLPSLFGNADPRHTRIALDMMSWYAFYGENCPMFIALAREILHRDHPELYDDEET